MRKSHIRDYATAAYRFWALNGRPTKDEYEKRIRDQAMRQNKEKDPAIAYKLAEIDVDIARPSVLDISACELAFKLLKAADKEHIIKAVEDVYMWDPQRELHKQEISERVLRVALNTPASEREVYRWLAEARNLFAALRGLRPDEED